MIVSKDHRCSLVPYCAFNDLAEGHTNVGGLAREDVTSLENSVALVHVEHYEHLVWQATD